MMPPTIIPAWLNETFFEEIYVSQHRLEPGKFEVRINSVTPTGGAGENYTSSLYRANVDAVCDDGNIITLAVIIKAIITRPEMKQFSVFAREKHFYERTLPSMEQLWADAGETTQFGPRCWKVVEGDTDIIVMDDLGAEGYSVANRRQGADLQHAKIFLGKLAKFHAAGAVLYRKDGPTSDLYECMLVNPKGKGLMEQYIKKVKPVFLAILSSSPDDEIYKSKMEKCMENQFDKIGSALKFEDTDFITLCHADVWTNNHMYNYHQSGTPKDVILIDYQGSFYGSPVTDLFYYIVSSASLELKATQFDELVQYYHSQLADALKTLKYRRAIPSLRDIHIDMLKRGYFGLQCLYGILPVVLLDKNENANMDGFFGESEENEKFRHDVYNNPLYYKHLKVLLKLFDVRGLLDF